MILVSTGTLPLPPYRDNLVPLCGKYSSHVSQITPYLPEGKKFTVEAVNNSPENIYIQCVEWNGKPYNSIYLLHGNILQGGVLKIQMGNKPNSQWGR